MRKKILSLAMLPLLIIGMLSVLSVNIVKVSAPVYPVITFAPENIVNTTANLPINHVFNWPISTDYNGSDIWGYEFTIVYNPVVLNVLNVSNGDLIVNTVGDSGATFLNGTIDNTLGKLSVTSAYFYYDEGLSPPVNVTSGDGTLATVEFKVMDVGDSDITFGPETKLIGWNTTTDEEFNIIDETMVGHTVNGYFANTNPIHNVKITSVSANETSVFSGELVDVTVVAQNAGNVTEKFDVTAYHSTSPIGTQTITLGASASQTLHFIWDTTSERFNISISAEASDVGSAYDLETNTTDNTKVDGTVWVRPPILAVMNSTGGNEIIDTTMGGGDTFFVTINITDAYDLDMAMFNLTWNDAILRSVYIVKGDFFGGVSHAFGVNNGTGYALISYNRTGGGPGLNGNGSIANITFRILTKGGSLIELNPYPTWWTTYWTTTPVIVNAIHSNYYDMGFQPGSYIIRGWVYPRWLNAIPQRIVVYPRNNGFLYLTYNMSVYANGTLAATEIQTLVGKQHSPGNKRTYTFEWDYTGWGWGKVYIIANITDVDPIDNNPGNNYEDFGGGYVTVRITGDTDGDADVDFDDFIVFAGDYGTEEGDALYDLVSEMDADGDVDFDDFIIFAGKYGYSTTSY